MKCLRYAAALAVVACAAAQVVSPVPGAAASSPAAWSVSATPDTSATLTNVLNADTCVSGGDCVAVGNSTTSTGVAQTLVESWNGTAWSKVSSPDTSPTLADTLYGVSCAAASSCMAVGSATSTTGYLQTLAERWNGTTWAIVSTPDTSTVFPNSLSGVSCSSTTSCVAVGSAATSTGSVTVVETWNGSSWTLTPSPEVAGTAADSLAAVSCPTTASCTAVGYDVDGSGAEQTLVEAWGGSAWSVVTSPDTTAKLPNALNGVSCTSASACTAVGGAYAVGGTAEQTLVETWSGSTWSAASSPDPTTGDDELQAVSCGTGGCTAVGYSTTSGGIEQGLVEASSGAPWAVVTTPEPGLYGNSLQGVGCVGTACVATGSEETGAGLLQTLGESDLEAPTVTVPPTAAFTFGLSGTAAVTSTGSPLPTFTETGAPNGVTIDPVTGTLTGEPSKIGTYTVVVTASNGVAPASSGTLRLTVTGPVVTSTDLPNGTPDVPYSYQLTASGAAAPLLWKKGAGLPRGLKVSSSGVISGTPSKRDSAGVYSFKVSVTEVTAVGKVKVVAPLSLELQ